jgi:hypothetical protein
MSASTITFAELVARIEADTKDFDRNLTASQKKIIDFAKATETLDRQAVVSAKQRTQLQRQAADSFLATLAKEQAATNNWGNVLEETAGKLGAIAGPAAALVSIGTGLTAALFGAAKSAADAGDRLFELYVKTGFSVETLSAMDAAAQLTGTSVEKLSVGLVIFDKNLEAARQGGEKQSELFGQLNVDLASQDKVLAAVFNRLNSLSDGATRSAEAVKYFGRSGAEMLKVIREAHGDLESFKQSLADMGVLITGPEAEAAHKFEQDLRRLNLEFAALGRQVGEEVIPHLEGKLQELAGFIADNRTEIHLFAAAVGELSELSVPPVILAFIKAAELGSSIRHTITDYLSTPDAGFASGAPQGESAPQAPNAPTEHDRQLKEQIDGLNGYIDQFMAKYFAAEDKIVKGAEDAIKSLRAELNTLGDSSKYGAVTELFRKLRAEAEGLGPAIRSEALAALNQLEPQALQTAKTIDLLNNELEQQKKAQQEATEAAKAYSNALTQFHSDAALDFYTKLGMGAQEAAEMVKLDVKAYGELDDKARATLLTEARRKDVRTESKRIDDEINQVLGRQLSLVQQVNKLLANPEAANQLTARAREQLRMNAALVDGLVLLKDWEKVMTAMDGLNPPDPAGLKDFGKRADAAARRGITINPTILGEPVPTAIDQIELYIHQHAGDLARDVTDIWAHSLNDLFQNGFQSFFADILSGFAHIAETIALDYIEGKIGKALNNLSLGGGGGGGGGFWSTLISIGASIAGAFFGGGGGAFVSTGAGNFGGAYFADGGFVTGPGTSTSDSIHAMLSNHEFVMNAQAVSRYGPRFMESVNRGEYNPQAGNAQGGGKVVHIGTINFNLPNVREPHQLRTAARAMARDLAEMIEHGRH